VAFTGANSTIRTNRQLCMVVLGRGVELWFRVAAIYRPLRSAGSQRREALDHLAHARLLREIREST
jgi:hypothetical protein